MRFIKILNFKNLSLKYKILVIILTGFLAIFLSGMIVMGLISKSYEKKLFQSTASSLSHSASQISSTVEYFDTVIDSIMSNQTIQDSLDHVRFSTSRSEKRLYQSRIYTALCNYLFTFNNEFISYMAIVQSNDIICTSDLKFQEIPKSVRTQLIKRADNEEGATTVVTQYGPEYGVFLVKKIKKIEGLSLDDLGYLIIQMDMADLIASSNSSASGFENASYFLFERENIVYHDELFSQKEAMELNQHLNSSYNVVELDHQKLFAVRGKIPIYEWDYICTISYDSVYRTIALSSRLFLGFMVLTMILVSYLSIRLIFALFRRFDQLIDNMKRFGEGNYSIPENVSTYSQDEIGLLYKNFDTMVEKIQQLITENYVNELLKKEAQIKAMESQMDPHFLYNTLDSINWRARMIKSEEISQITTALGNLLRMSLGQNSQSFTLKQEMSIVDDYITIQKIRYQKRLHFTASIPESLLGISIPKFTIQPLLENAMRYGLEESSETCFIAITTEEISDKVILRITNTGSAFEPDFMEKLLLGEISPHGFGIGLLNIHKRLQMTYGPEFGLNLYNLEDEETYEEYAVAEVHIPKKERNKSC